MIDTTTSEMSTAPSRGYYLWFQLLVSNKFNVTLMMITQGVLFVDHQTEWGILGFQLILNPCTYALKYFLV